MKNYTKCYKKTFIFILLLLIFESLADKDYSNPKSTTDTSTQSESLIRKTRNSLFEMENRPFYEFLLGILDTLHESVKTELQSIKLRRRRENSDNYDDKKKKVATSKAHSSLIKKKIQKLNAKKQTIDAKKQQKLKEKIMDIGKM